jgi:lipid II:glycine glycyltransferase (peptidoglycan interpeptide bridge formation enzyme)
MSDLTELHTDARQTPQWQQYMSSIGWKIEMVDHTPIFIRKVLNNSLVKVQHVKGPINLAEIEQLSRRHKALFTLIEPHIEGYHPEDYLTAGFIRSKLRTGFSATELIDLRPSETDIFNSFSENARRNIKKAQKNNLTVEVHYIKDQTDDTVFNKFYELYKNVARMKNFYVLPPTETKNKLNAFKESSFILFAYEPQNPHPIATVWYSWFEKTLVYFHTGITERGYQLLANYLLVWEGLKTGQHLQLQVMDFEAIYDSRFPSQHKDWIGYSQFKSRFHGEIVQYPDQWIKIYNVPYKLLYLWSTLFTSS